MVPMERFEWTVYLYVGGVPSEALERMQDPEIRSNRKPLHPTVEELESRVLSAEQSTGGSSGCRGMPLPHQMMDRGGDGGAGEGQDHHLSILHSGSAPKPPNNECHP